MQAGEAALALMRDLCAGYGLQEKQTPDPKPESQHGGMGDVDEDEGPTTLPLEEGEMLPNVPTDDSIELAGFHAAMSVFPSHLCVGLVKEDGSFCITDDLMRDLWQAKGPKNGA